MKKMINRLTGILCLPAALLWLVFYKLTRNTTEQLHYAQFVTFILHTIKTGKFENPNSAPKRVYP